MAQHSQFKLLSERRFGPFFLTQFLGAFNDNVFKNALVIMIAYQVAVAEGSKDLLVNLAAGLFILPFFLFSASSGQLADKFEKSALIRKIKLLEVGIMGLAAVAFLLQSVPMLFLILFLMGFQSALFGPVKFGILPQHLREHELVGGNGLVEMGTFLAILLGTIVGGVLIAIHGVGPMIVAAVVVAIAALGYLASRRIPIAAPVDPGLTFNWNLITATVHNVRFARENRTVFLSILGISWFWFYGATVLAQLPNYAPRVLGGNEHVLTVLLALFSVGIGLGSLLCERLSGHKVEIGLVPLGSIGMTVFGADLYFARPDYVADAALIDAATFLADPSQWRIIADIVLLGLFSGFYIVPLQALVQSRSEPSRRSRIIAANNIINAGFMVGSALFAIALLSAGLTIPQLILATAVVNAVVALYIYTLVPEFLWRFLVWILINVGYRIDAKGLQQVPDEGPCLLVCNHVSYVDALIIAGCIRRPVRFVMDHRIYDTPVLHAVFRLAGAIPIASARANPKLLEQAFERISDTLRAGEVVCIFPEGRLTADGEIGEFRAGTERILKRDPVPVVPLALKGLWGSVFSRKHGGAFKRLPRAFRSRIALEVGDVVAPDAATIDRLRERVMQLRGQAA